MSPTKSAKNSSSKPSNTSSNRGARNKASYTGKQRRKAEHIEDSYKEKGVPSSEAERRAWATVNKQDGGRKKSGSGRK